MSDSRPNILIVIVHDLGDHLRCYGWPSVPSPRLDALAEQGVRFERHFGTAPYCSPARGALFTGQHPHVNGLMGLVNLDWDLPEGTTTLAMRLGQAGYETFLFGLQHEVKQTERLGFHHYPAPGESKQCGDVAERAAAFLRSRGRGERPFYARVGFFEVHRPYRHYSTDGADQVDVPPHMKDTPGAREDLAQFHHCIQRTDEAVGVILDALDASGLAEETLVVFTTDHGIAFPRAKATLYDPGIHTALLMRWPGRLPAGETRTELLSGVDFTPTILDAAGAEIPEGLDGRSFWPLFDGRPYEPRTEIFAEKNASPLDAKRCIRTERFKYIVNYDEGPMLMLPTDVESSSTRRDMGDEHLQPRPPVELYDLQADPHEQTNLAGAPEFEAVEKELAARLHQFMADTNDPRLRGPVPRPPGEKEKLVRAFVASGLTPPERLLS